MCSSDLAEREAQYEAEQEAAAIAEFEAQVATNLELGAADRATAIRWVIDTLNIGAQWEKDYVAYSLGLPYNTDLLDPAADYIKQRGDEEWAAWQEAA